MKIHTPAPPVSVVVLTVLALWAPESARAADTPAQCSAQLGSIALSPQGAVRELSKAPRYTQGLVVHEDRLYESAGMFGHSGVYALALDGSDESRLTTLDESRFGEGLAILGDRAYNLTWRAQVAYVFDLQGDGSFEPAEPTTLPYEGEGWGLTPYEGQLLLSDGTATVRVVDPEDFSVTRQIDVRAGNRPVAGLNELETVGDQVLANIYGPPLIVAIDPRTGCVTLAIDASALAKDVRPLLSTGPGAVCGSFGCTANDYVLNGIAYDAER
ncbi:MAG: glutaminyl-peptide cyclotransferase, partial [Pseudomonadota bacterium]